jgi:hypothetical protein
MEGSGKRKMFRPRGKDFRCSAVSPAKATAHSQPDEMSNAHRAATRSSRPRSRNVPSPAAPKRTFLPPRAEIPPDPDRRREPGAIPGGNAYPTNVATRPPAADRRRPPRGVITGTGCVVPAHTPDNVKTRARARAPSPSPSPVRHHRRDSPIHHHHRHPS